MDSAVLTITDLTTDSAPALQLAGIAAVALRSRLDILHPLGLKRQALRTAVPALETLHQRIDEVDRRVREQLRAVLPGYARAARPVIDFDDAAAALLRRTSQLRPHLTVVSTRSTAASAFTGVAAHALAQLASPLLFVRDMGDFALPLMRIPHEGLDAATAANGLLWAKWLAGLCARDIAAAHAWDHDDRILIDHAASAVAAFVVVAADAPAPHFAAALNEPTGPVLVLPRGCLPPRLGQPQVPAGLSA